MKKVIQFIGKIFIGIAIVFLIIQSFLVVSDGSSSTDIFGLGIPYPPLWTAYVPGLGSIIGFIYQYFSIHGLVSIVGGGLILGIGIYLSSYKESK